MFCGVEEIPVEVYIGKHLGDAFTVFEGVVGGEVDERELAGFLKGADQRRRA